MILRNLVLLALVFVLVPTGDAFAKKKRHPRDWQPVPDSGEQHPTGANPDCLDGDRRAMSPNNEQVIRWKETSRNQYKDRAYVTGKFIKTFQLRKSHFHFGIELDARRTNNNPESNQIEIIYNRSFGDIPEPKAGDKVEICGDYITANAQAGRYQPSPLGAIIHWVHLSRTPNTHSHGFVMINGEQYGDDGEAKEFGKMPSLLPTDMMRAWMPQAAGF